MVKFSYYENPLGVRSLGLSISTKPNCCASSSQILLFEEAEVEISGFMFKEVGIVFIRDDGLVMMAFICMD